MFLFIVVNALGYTGTPLHRHISQFTGTPLKLKETNTSTKHKMLKNTTGEKRFRWLYIRNMTDEINYCRVYRETTPAANSRPVGDYFSCVASLGLISNFSHVAHCTKRRRIFVSRL